jgi:hypothetical protein
MNRLSGKIISAMVLTILLAMGVHQYAVKLRQMDRAEYLAEQGRRYDRQHAHPDYLVVQIFACGFLVGGTLVVYEVLAFGAFKLLNKTALDEKRPRG